MDITKVIVPAAGLDDRFLPYSKSVCKEMLPILRKPAIHHLAQEAYESALQAMVMVTSSHKNMLIDYFDPHRVNPHHKNADPADYLSSIKKIQSSLNIISVQQYEPLGTGHAVWLARHTIGKEYFAVAYPDDLIFGKQPALAQMMRIAHQEKASVIAVQEVPHSCIGSYGVIGVRKTITPNLFQVSSVVEKPQAKDAPSSLAIVGRYILSSKVIGILDEMMAYDNQEVSLTDAIGQLLHSNERVFAYKVNGTRYDIGSHLGWVKAVIATSLQDNELGPPIRSFLTDFDTAHSFMYKPAKMIQDNL